MRKNLKKTAIFSASTLALAVASASHAFEFEAGETKVDIYGYAKLDVIHDVDNEIGEKSVTRSAIALDGDDSSDGHTNLFAGESRIGFTTTTPLSGSTLRTTIEGDFFAGDANAPEFRLRHAFGEWNGILAGQTWTNFASFVPGTPTIDFTGPGGRANLDRQTQLRYTTGGFSVAIEDPNKLGGEADAGYASQAQIGVDGNGDPVFADTTTDTAKNELPDLTARYEGESGIISYSASALLRQLGYDADGSSGAPADWGDDSATGYGLALAAAVDVTERLTLRGGISHGDGIGGYVHGNPAAPAYVDDNGDLDTIKASGGTVGASLKAGPGAINVAYTLIDADLNEDNASAADDETYEDIWVNYIWSPGGAVSYGVEASWHSREQFDGQEGDALRLQGMVKYDF